MEKAIIYLIVLTYGTLYCRLGYVE